MHDCPKCTFVLSSYAPDATRADMKVIDWYVCSHDLLGGSVVGRVSSKTGDYWSRPVDLVDDDRYLVASWEETCAVPPMVLMARAVLLMHRDRQRKRREAECPTVRLTTTDVQIPRPDSRDFVELWGLTGMPGVLYPTKLAAEAAARERWPHESEDKRYARVHFERFYSEV